MDEASLGTGICRFQKGDYVAIKSKAACSNVHVNSPPGSRLEMSTLLDKVGRVESVTPTDDVKVAFGKTLVCTVASEDLIKIENLKPGDLVKLVDDIRGEGNLTLEDGEHLKSATKACGHICLVLGNFVENNGVVYVTVGAEVRSFRPLHLDFVARPLYGDFKARLIQCACKEDVSKDLAVNLFAALQGSMQDLPDVMIARSKSSPYEPGNSVELSSDVRQFIQWQLRHSTEETADPSEKKFQRLQDYAQSQLHESTKRPFPMEQVASLLQPGRVVQVNSDGDVLVEFRDGRVWCFRSSFLQLIQNAEAGRDGAGTCSPKDLSDGIDKVIRFAYNEGHQDKSTLLHAACFSGNQTLIELMLGGTLGLDCADTNGNTPLHYAAHGNQPHILIDLIEKGANINATNSRNQTALQFAVKEGFLECVRRLTSDLRLKRNIQDDMGNTPLHVAIAGMNEEMVNVLADLPKVNFALQNKYGLNTLHMAALTGNVRAAEKILSKTKDLVNVQQENQGFAALHFAAVNGHGTLVDTLLKQESCKVDLLTKYQETALLLAAREGHWDIVQSLIKAGANINRADRLGNTALHWSLMKVNEQPVEPLVKPLSLAIKEVKKILDENVDTRLLLPCVLVLWGADFRLKNKKALTPLDIASGINTRLAEMFWEIRVAHKATSTASSAGTSPPSNLTPERNEVMEAGKPMLGEGIYTMKRKPRGMCIIINNINFEPPFEKREGAERDAEKMKKLFTDLHFDVTDHTNLTAKDMAEVLKQAANAKQQEDADCLVVILMSHGSTGVIFGVDGEELKLHDKVYALFNNVNCRNLRGKPKLFFIQACRGDRHNYATDSSAADSGSPDPLPQFCDTYVAYSTILDYVSFRNTKDGSWFISAIYDVFRQHADTTDLADMMLKVTEEVMKHTTKDRVMQAVNQDLMGWRKKLYFNPGLGVTSTTEWSAQAPAARVA